MLSVDIDKLDTVAPEMDEVLVDTNEALISMNELDTVALDMDEALMNGRELDTIALDMNGHRQIPDMDNKNPVYAMLYLVFDLSYVCVYSQPVKRKVRECKNVLQ